MMKRWQETMVPGKYHDWLGQLVGEWETTTRMFMDPSGPPAESAGTCRVAWLVDRKWLRHECTGTMMGQPIRSFSTTGYDNFKKKYVAVMYDSMTTALLHAEGAFDRTGTELMMWGPMDEPMTGEHDKAVKYVTRIVDKDHFVFEVHDLHIGGDKTRVVEVDYRRKK